MLREIAEGPLLEQVLDGTYPVWNEGLSRTAFSQWVRAQGRTRWAAAHLRRVGLFDEQTFLSTAKRYVFNARVDGRMAAVLGIGAIHTPESLRGRGHASRLVEALLTDGAARGCTHALLFSEIGPGYYQRLGFQPVPRQEVAIDVPRSRRGAPAILVRALESSDLSEVAALSMRNSEKDGAALERTAELIEFGLIRLRLRAGLGPVGLRQVEAFVSEEGHRAVSYVVVSRGPEGVRLEDCGDRDPTGARVGAMLEVLAEREPSSQDRSLTGWLPTGMRPPQLAVTDTTPTGNLMMWRPISRPASPDDHAPEWSWRPLDLF